jgi:hypothetical protein
MFETTTPQALIDDVNYMTDNDGDSLISTAQYIAWMNAELSDAWQWMVRCNRDAFTKIKEGQVVTGNSISVIATAPTGLGLTDFLNIRGVDLKFGTNCYKKIRPWSFAGRDSVSEISYRMLGESLYLLPADCAATYPFRMWYVHRQPVASAAALTAELSIPDGVDDCIKQGMAAKVRMKLDDDPSPHMALQAAAKAGVKSWLMSSKGDQAVIANVDPDWDY